MTSSCQLFAFSPDRFRQEEADRIGTLESHGFNLTRAFSGAYCEPAGALGIRDNTLAPAAGRLICPWARSESPGYRNGGNKFDLRRWDPAYFRRRREFVSEAGRRGVVVELVLFCPYLTGSGPASVAVELPAGTYEARWINTKTGNIEKQEAVTSGSGMTVLSSPAFNEATALSIKRADHRKKP